VIIYYNFKEVISVRERIQDRAVTTLNM